MLYTLDNVLGWIQNQLEGIPRLGVRIIPKTQKLSLRLVIVRSDV